MTASSRISVRFVLPSFAGGGAERVILTVLAGLDRARFAPSLVVMTAEGPLASLMPDDTPLTDLRQPRLRRALPALARALRDDAPTSPHIICSTLGYLNQGVLALRPWLAGGARLVVREANLPLLGATGWPRQAMRLGYRSLYPRADVVLCPATRVATALAAIAPNCQRRLRVIHNPVDEAGLRAGINTPRRVEGTGPRFVASGRLTHQKGFDRLIDLLSKLPADAHVTILGEGPDRAALLSRATRLRVADRLSLPGFVADPWSWYAGADAFLLPSRWEGMPNAALEALACGTPVIAAPEAGGIDEIAATAAGAVTLAPLGDAFVTAMRQAQASQPTLGRSLLPERFKSDRVVAAYGALFSGLVN